MVADVSTSYAIAAAMLAVALGLGLFTLCLGRWLGPRPRPSTENPPPEHGGRTGHKTWVQFRVRYAVLALLFVAFDMEMVYMFPWAVFWALMGLIVFIAILAAAIVFAWKEGAFDWED